MTWQPEVSEIELRRQISLSLGGEERIARQHAEGKQTVRERIASLLDKDSFREVGQLAGRAELDGDGAFASFEPMGFVAGTGLVDGRVVCVGGNDFTVRGGSGTASHGGRSKLEYLEEAAWQQRCPLILFIDGAGADIRGMEEIQFMYLPYRDWSKLGRLLGAVPVVAAVVGPAAGGPAGIAVLSHWLVMIEGSSHLFAAGPPVVQRGIGQVVTKEELGGADLHTRISGVADDAFASEDEAIRAIRTYLSYLPSNVWELPPHVDSDDPPDRREEELLSIVPRNRKTPYDMRRVVELVVDTGSVFELKRRFGGSVITALARLGGSVVGIVANNPLQLAGALDADAAAKQTRFVEFCDVFHIPIIYFADVPGFMIGVEAEKKGTLRRAMRTVLASVNATVPQVTVLVRRAYGMGANAMGTPFNVNLRLGWPSGEWSSIPVEGGVAAAFKREIAEAVDPDQHRRMIEDRLLELQSPFSTAEAFQLEDLIDPRDTRPILVDYLGRHSASGPPPGPKYLVQP
jgi:acetyl-CoA carboxylase carboxyltransferase component